jgi:RHS repeat-associated protein
MRALAQFGLVRRTLAALAALMLTALASRVVAAPLPASPDIQVTLDLTGSGSGSVTSSPAGLTCSGTAKTCTGTLAAGASVTLSATPVSGHTFTAWGGACSGTGQCTFTAAQGLLVAATFQGTPSYVFYHQDAIGSVRALTNEAGDTILRHEYQPFGEDNQDNTGDPIRFGGKEVDAETALQNFKARYYRNILGRFTTIDPGQASGSIFDPQGWNAYAYARNNPLRFVDPSGAEYEVSLDNGTTLYLTNDEFDRLRDNPGAGISFDGGWDSGLVMLNYGVRRYGSYRYYYSLSDALRDAGNRAEARLQGHLTEMAVGAATGALFAPMRFVSPVVPKAMNSKLANIIDDLFKGLKGPSVPIGQGTTADALRYELATGLSVFGKSHAGKAQQYANALTNWLRANPNAARADRALAEALLRDLRNALSGR